MGKKAHSGEARGMMWGVYKIANGEPQLLGRFGTFEDAGAAADLYRATFTDSGEIRIAPEKERTKSD